MNDANLITLRNSTNWAIEQVQNGIASLDPNFDLPMMAGAPHHFPFSSTQDYPAVATTEIFDESYEGATLEAVENFCDRVQDLFHGDLGSSLGFFDSDGDMYGHLLSSLIPGAQWDGDLSEPDDIVWHLQGRHWFLRADREGICGLWVLEPRNMNEIHLPWKIDLYPAVIDSMMANLHGYKRPDPRYVVHSIEDDDDVIEMLPWEEIFKTYNLILDKNLHNCSQGYNREAVQWLVDRKNERNGWVMDICEEAGYTFR